MDNADFQKIITPDQSQVFLFVCPAALPFGIFARHPWFVVSRKGTISRWEIFWRPEYEWKSRWGHLHKDFYAPTEGIARYFFSKKYPWKNSKILGSVEGELAERVADFIEASPESYPYCDTYSLKGPNSNTYVQWVINEFPTLKLHLPWNSFGRGYNLKSAR
jgi:hypothetical protein